ncbi:hypothetical protein GWI33_019037 [Rhynchophorus ferrugineus]|uniref:Uncharacterized protein n=1 Tax=Rhynchophorus ferrugineus TaxID=354439 RepID=A0A834M7E7_RHYFE|nr:hypothetical protein GWI33_019037 [Rhynchophorus ferrugineus]
MSEKRSKTKPKPSRIVRKYAGMRRCFVPFVNTPPPRAPVAAYEKTTQIQKRELRKKPVPKRPKSPLCEILEIAQPFTGRLKGYTGVCYRYRLIVGTPMFF